MAGFVASEQVDELTYDFKPHGPEGTIPEPSATQIQDFRQAIAQMFQDMVPEDMDDEAKAVSAVKRVVEFLGKDTSEEQQKILQTVAAVCSDNPSFDVLDKLPYRHQQAFIGWLSGVLLIPKALTPVTT